jgi:hypothetical protein
MVTVLLFLHFSFTENVLNSLAFSVYLRERERESEGGNEEKVRIRIQKEIHGKD